METRIEMKTNKISIGITFCESDIISQIIGIYCCAPRFYHVKKNMCEKNKNYLNRFGDKITRLYWNIFHKNTHLVNEAQCLSEVRERLNHVHRTAKVSLKELNLTLVAFRASFNEYSFSVDYYDLEIFTGFPIISITE
jgi:hypothetical protein